MPGVELSDQVTADRLNAAIVDTVIDAIVTIDATGTILSFNRSAERIFGYRYLSTRTRQLVRAASPPTRPHPHFNLSLYPAQPAQHVHPLLAFRPGYGQEMPKGPICKHVSV